MKPRIYKPTAKKEDFETNGLGILSDTTRCDVTEEANGRYEVELEHPLNSRFKPYFDNGFFIKAKPNDKEEYMIFEIKNTYEDTMTNNILIYGVSRTQKLGNRSVQKVEIKSQSGTSAMKSITNGMDMKSDIELFSDIPTISSTTFEARNVLNCIAGEQGSMLQLWGGEIKHEAFKLSLLQRRGRDNVGTVRYGKDLNGLKIKLDWSSIITRVLPYADLQSNGDGQTKRIYGEPVDSLLINNYPDVYARHIQFTEEQGVIDLDSLNRVSKNYFTSINPRSDQPKIQIELEIEKLSDSKEAKEFAKLRNYNLFDTFKIRHKLYDIDIDSKITTVVYDSLTEKTKKVHAGDSRMSFFVKQNSDLQETIKGLSKKGYMSEFVDYVTKIISGNDGGHVIWWPKNRPTDLFFCDKPSLEEARQLLRINKSGIGFSDRGWKGPFKTAWTLDGILTLGEGMLQIGTNKGGRFLETTDKGLQFFKKDLSLGRIGTSSKSFWGATQSENKEETTDKSIAIELDDEGEFIQLLGSEKVGLYIPNSKKNPKGSDILLVSNDPKIGTIVGTSSAMVSFGGIGNEKKINFLAPGGLFLNGKEIVPGQGGGGGSWNGQYPSEITSNTDKFAWELWSILLAKGYSKAAVAGILGNVQGEVGPNMNPDTAQSGGSGPGYGIVQWDGSSYPLVGPPTWSGREYVQRLMDAAKINDDYRTMRAQAQLVDWCMYNGQWIGQVTPTSVTEFKKSNSPQQAARAFELNFERPAASHPERQGWALTWYNKFKDLKQPTGSGKYVRPMNNYTVTSEFGWRNSPLGGGMEFHNAIDLANGGGSPIFASNNGEVVQASGEYFDWYGNYVVIKHPDGLYTGYAHLSKIMVSRGQKVTQGQQIGIEGSTGPVTGPHLHFQFMKRFWPNGNDDFINPRSYVQF